MSRELVSVMMPAFNAEKYVGEAIKSLLVQSYPNWELIVVDDGSTDETASVVTGFNDPRIKLVQQLNGGESAARNTALKHMRGEYVAFLDADDVYLPHHLGLAVEYLVENSYLDGAYTDGYYCDSSLRMIKTLSSRRRGPYQGDVFAEAVRGSDLFGPPVSIVLRRRPIIDHKLLFDEDITIGPDWVFLMQFAAVGQFGYLDQRTCLYRLHDTNISLRIDLQQRARELAKCRMRAIQMDRFDECPVDVRSNVFYDLLINSYRDCPEEQLSITQMPQFHKLPAKDKARLFRLMAVRSLLSNRGDRVYVGLWLHRSRELDSSDRRTSLLLQLHNLSPQLAKKLIEIKGKEEIDPLTVVPFSDIDMSLNVVDSDFNPF